MNSVQLKYTRQRATDLKDQKLKVIRAKYAPKPWTHEERRAEYDKGNYKVLPPKQNYGGYYVTFTNEVEQRFDQESFDKEASVINNQFTKLLDELILGDNDVALALLKEFEAL